MESPGTKWPHHCHWHRGCGKWINGHFMFCREHWREVPPAVRSRFWSTVAKESYDDLRTIKPEAGLKAIRLLQGPNAMAEVQRYARPGVCYVCAGIRR